MIFHQLFEKETSTYTYLLADEDTKDAVLIDPVLEMVERDVGLIHDLGLRLKFVLDTHVHADHVTASGEIRKRTGAKVGISSAYDLACPDLHLEDGQELKFGSHTLKAIHTPGHTNGCLSFQVGEMIFTGDALLVRGCGRTDFQEGSSEKLFHSVRRKIFSLPDTTIVYPGHDYRGFSKTTVDLEKRTNPRLMLSIQKDQFIEIMANLKLPYPKRINEAVPANQLCGLLTNSHLLRSDDVEGVPTVTPEELYKKLGHVKLIDVRGEDEFNNELGHIPSSSLSTLGEKLLERLDEEKKQEEIVFVCRSGKRSAQATLIAIQKGFEKVYSLEGGMLKWDQLRYSVERDKAGS